MINTVKFKRMGKLHMTEDGRIHFYDILEDGDYAIFVKNPNDLDYTNTHIYVHGYKRAKEYICEYFYNNNGTFKEEVVE